MNLLKISIYQPQAHYRIPFTYRRRHTYPLPPYSTIIGFFCNVLGIDDQRKIEYQKLKAIKLSIAGSFANKITEYIWFRNLLLKNHVARFGYAKNRYIGGHIDHIGSQSPISIDVLNDMYLKIYLAHDDLEFLLTLKNALENPRNRLEILHIGRAEDWIVLDQKPVIINQDRLQIKRRDANYKHFFWIPEVAYLGDLKLDHPFNFNQFDGLLYNIPSFWEVSGFDETLSRHGERVFDYARTKLNDGLLKENVLLLDTEDNFPIFLADFNNKRDNL
jgi:CRISPR-associated protein Cas5t